MSKEQQELAKKHLYGHDNVFFGRRTDETHDEYLFRKSFKKDDTEIPNYLHGCKSHEIICDLSDKKFFFVLDKIEFLEIDSDKNVRVQMSGDSCVFKGNNDSHKIYDGLKMCLKAKDIPRARQPVSFWEEVKFDTAVSEPRG